MKPVEGKLEDLSGRHLDVAVALEVMGWCATVWEEGKKVALSLGGGGELPREFVFVAKAEHSPVEHYRFEQVEEVGDLLTLDLPHFSTDMVEAMGVVDAVRSTVFPGWPGGFQLSDGEIGQEHESLSATVGGWAATFDNGYGNETFDVGGTAPKAICRAALKAVREGDDE